MMVDSIFDEGGPYHIERISPDKISMQTSIPADPDGFIGRNCPDSACSPGYFKIKLGTGITGIQLKAYCPYCRREEAPNGFFTEAQIDYAKQIIFNEAAKGINKMFQNALDLDSSGSKHLGGGMFSVELNYKPGNLPSPVPPIEGILRRDLVCPNCGLEHAVFGLATWCPDCGKDIFLTHVIKEFEVIQKMLGDNTRRQDLLGARVAARDIENALEDVVSIYEAAMRTMTRRKMGEAGLSDEQIEDKLKKIGNKYQNIELARKVIEDEFDIKLLEGFEVNQVEALRVTFEKRHPITHNLGIIDRKYLEKARSGELKGRDVKVSPKEMTDAMALVIQLLQRFHSLIFPDTSK